MESKTIYNVYYFIKKFEAIPESLWCVRSRAIQDKRCALGWCYPTKKEALLSENIWYKSSLEDESLVNLFKTHFDGMLPGGTNNGVYKQYPQPTPKQRVLAALYDIKKMQEKIAAPLYIDITKDLATLPTEETSDVVKSMKLKSINQ